MTFLSDLATVVAALLVFGTLLVGLGSALVAWAERGLLVSLSTRVWLGVAVAFVVLEPLHLVLPVAGVARVSLGGIALWGLWAERQELRRELSGLRRWEWGAAVTGLFIIGLLALDRPAEGDASLYHYGAVRWAASYPVVPGVALLNPFLGYGHGNFLLHALLEVGPLAHRTHHVVNPLLVFVTAARCARVASQAPSRASSVSPTLAAIGFVPVVTVAGGGWLVSPSSNVGEAMFGLVLVLEYVRLIEQEPAARAWVVATLAVAVVVFKLSSAVLAAGCFLVAAWRLRRHEGARARLSTALVVLLAGLGWLAGGAVRTGYLLYPFVSLPLSVDWRVPEDVPTSITRYIAAYGRGTFHRLVQGLDDGAWWGPWLERAAVDNALLFPALVLVVSLVVAAARSKSRSSLGWLLPSLAALAGWFLVSPDVQYLGALLAANVGLALGLAVKGGRGHALPVGGSLVALVWLVALPRAPLVALDQRGLRDAPRVEPRQREIEGGRLGEAPALNCGDAPLPCAGLVEPGLRFRVPGVVARGFALDRRRDPTLAAQAPPRWRIDADFVLGRPR